MSPEEVIRELNAAHAADAPAADGPRWLPFASERLARSWASAVEEARDVIYDSDSVVDAQDFGRIERLRVTVRPGGERAAAVAKFVNLGKPTKVRFDLVREGGTWRIDDVHPSGNSLNVRIRDTVVAGDGC